MPTDPDHAAEYRRYADDLDRDAALLAPTDQRATKSLAAFARLFRDRADQLDPTPPNPPREPND